MNILFLGYAVSPDCADNLLGASVAGNKMQLSIIKELSNYDDITLQSITVYPVAPYPHNALLIKKSIIALNQGLFSIRIGFLNLPLIKQINQICSVYMEASKKVDKETIILMFNAFPQVGLPALWLKNRFHCKVCCLLPDPPVNMQNEGLLKKIFNYIARKVIRNSDSLIVLNEEAIHRYAKPNTPYVVVQGGIDSNNFLDFNLSSISGKTSRNLLYTGALTKYSGIMELISAMDKLKSNSIYLDIYGSGYLEPEIINASKSNPQIRFHGRIPNTEVMQRQREAWLLVNPRRVDEPISQVTFPSKIFEYMVSGTPVLTTKINGLTNDFLEHLFVVNDNSDDNLAMMIDYIAELNDEEMQKKASNALKFIVEEKNWKKQVSLIKKLLDDI